MVIILTISKKEKNHPKNVKTPYNISNWINKSINFVEIIYKHCYYEYTRRFKIHERPRLGTY